MTTELKNRIPRKDLPGFLLILFIGLSIMIGRDILFNNLNHHTTGVVVRNYKDVNGYESTTYQYSVNGKLYNYDKSYAIDGFEKPTIGTRYYVSFVSYIPSWSTIHLDKPVSDSIQAPDGGWVGDFDSLYLLHNQKSF